MKFIAFRQTIDIRVEGKGYPPGLIATRQRARRTLTSDLSVAEYDVLVRNWKA